MKKIRASLTVEAAFIVPMVFIVVGIMLALWIYEYQFCWYTQTVSECLITGSNQSILTGTDAALVTKEKWDNVKSGIYITLQQLSEEFSGDEDTIVMDVSGQTFLWGNETLNINIIQEIQIVRPVEFIRKIAAIEEALEN